MDNLQIMKNFNWSMLTCDVLAAICSRYDNKWANDGKNRVKDDFDRLYFIESGEAFVRDENGKSVHLFPGRLYLFPGGETARYYRCPESMILAWAHFRIEAIPGLSFFSKYDPPSSVKAPKDASKLFRLLIESRKENSPRGNMLAIGYLMLLVQGFAPFSWEGAFPSSDKLEQLKPALVAIQHGLGSPFDLEKLAKSVSLHPTYFSNMFKKMFEITPFQYYKRLLMRKASAMLEDDSNSISAVAYACGYDDPLYFSRTFNNYFGMSPSAYRKTREKFVP